MTQLIHDVLSGVVVTVAVLAWGGPYWAGAAAGLIVMFCRTPYSAEK